MYHAQRGRFSGSHRAAARRFTRAASSRIGVVFWLLVALGCAPGSTPAPTPQRAPVDPLPSWNEGAAKASIINFVEAVSADQGPDFVPAAERIATFDNDGTLWVEKPMYTQFAFGVDRVKALAPQHPEWSTTEPFKSLLEGDMEGVHAAGMAGIMEILMVGHAGMTTEEYRQIVEAWIGSATHPRFERPYTELVYQPMIELLVYLRAHGFKTFIVSGGGVEFMRPWTDEVYGIPPEQVVGTSIKTRFEINDGVPVLIREPELFFFDDKEGKAVGIQKFIGRRPIAAFGNSDGDLAMLQWTLAGEGRRLGMLVHHTDAEREYAYDRDSAVGALAKGLDDAGTGGWSIIDMKEAWNRVFAFEE